MKPLCDKCGGFCAPEYNFMDQVTAVRCLICGNRVYRDFRLRRPSGAERDTHKLARM